MVRKYPYADITFIAVLLLDFTSLFILNSNKLLVGIIGVLAIGIAVFVLLYQPVKLHGMLSLFNTNVVAMLLFFFYSEINGIDSRWVVPSILGCTLAMICLIIMRADAKIAKGKLISFVIFILVLAVAFGLSVSVAEPAGKLLVSSFSAIGRFLDYIGDAVSRFFNWLISLLPDAASDGYQMTTGPAVKIELPEEAGEASNPSLAGTIVSAIVVLAGLVGILRKLLRNGIAKADAKERAVVIRKKKTKLSIALEKLFKHLVHEMRMLLFMMGKSSLAKYYRMVYSRRFTPSGKKNSETPREFVLRIMGNEADEKFIEEIERELYLV